MAAMGDILWAAAMLLLGAGIALLARRGLSARRAGKADLSRTTLQAFFDHVPISMTLHQVEMTPNGLDGRLLLGTKPIRDFYENIAKDLGTLTMRSMFRFWPEFETWQAALNQTVAEGEPLRMVTPYRLSPEAEEQLIDLTIFPIRSEDGRIVQMGSLGLDITEQFKARREAERARATLQAFFDYVPAGMSIKDRDRKFTMINEFSARAYYGREPGEMIGKNAADLRTSRHSKRLLEMEQQVLDTGQVQIEDVVFGSEDKQRQIHLIVFPIFGYDGSITQIGAMAHDVTEQHQAKTDLAAQQANLLAFFDYAPLQVYVTDLDHKIEMVNDWVHRETGADVFLPKNVIGLSADQMVPSSWAELSHDNDSTVVGRRDVTQVEVRGQFGGKERDIISLRFPIKNDDGEVVRIGGFVVDVTRQKDAERALQAQLAQSHQSEKLAALGQLLAGVAHELNNPLTVVVGRSAILQEKLAGTPHEKSIASLREAADRCNRIVKTFLAMARQSTPRRGRVKPNDAIEAALDMTVYAIRSAGIALDCRLAPDLPEVEADEDQLVQVITNLLINAQHALDGHDGPRTIRIATKPVKGCVTIEIADSGPGVPEELETRIFEPFFTTKDVGKGTGMGLAMARGMIEEHGGTLTYRHAPGGGACFEVSLPVAAGSVEERKGEQEPDRPGTSRGRVLIVDDEPSIREMLGEILAAAGLEFVEAGDGAEALQQLAGQHFDLIFCDVRMPGMDGTGLRRELVANRPELLERLVFMSGDVLQRDRASFAEIGDHQFVEKPFDPAEVRRIALEILGQPGETR